VLIEREVEMFELASKSVDMESVLLVIAIAVVVVFVVVRIF